MGMVVEMAAELRLLAGPGVPGDIEEGIVQTYREAFSGPPYFEGEEAFFHFLESLRRHRQRHGFRLVVASVEDSVVGFAYGYASGPGDWWREVVARAASEDLRQDWFRNFFSFAELAVRPSFQGRGIGGDLHDALLSGVTQGHAALSTLAADTPALRLYFRKGWISLIARLVFPGGDRPFTVMGKLLG